jgi:hypothetical protein
MGQSSLVQLMTKLDLHVLNVMELPIQLEVEIIVKMLPWVVTKE